VNRPTLTADNIYDGSFVEQVEELAIYHPLCVLL